jgi:hypothetical protein
MTRNRIRFELGLLVVAASWIAVPTAFADVVTDWNVWTSDIAAAAKMPTPPTVRAMAIIQTAVYEAVNAGTKRYPGSLVTLEAAPGASIDAAVAAANRATLSKLVPMQQASIDSVYRAALSAIAESPAKVDGIALGEKAAAAVLALRADDGGLTPEGYRPYTAAGHYVPTVVPVASQWPQRKPWVMTSASQFRPGPPPSLTSKLWARDYAEIKALGSKNSTQRTAEQTEIARFWEASGPTIYYPVVRSLAALPGREVTQNARLLMAVAQAMDDGAIAVFDAKYHYGFWRPMTAIRNGDQDGNDATERDALWTPFIDTPMHPEYPCAHCIASAALGAVLQAEIGTGATPTLSTTSPTAPGVVRRWTKISDFVQEVANARIYDGVHYRNSTEVGSAMGKQVGELVAAKYLRSGN